MLCLSRKTNESVFIGDHEVKILKVHNNIVQIGITADKSVLILRGELHDKRPANTEEKDES